jgi:phosphohistidine phosphatase
MKRLTLVRHAHAKVEVGPVRDFERPLSRRGKAEAKSTAAQLLAAERVPDLLITSPATRTLQTAEILAQALQLPERHVRRDEALYLAEPDAILKAIHATGPRIGHLMIVGHNPGISVIANALAPEAQLGEFATGGACTMEIDVQGWSAVRAGCGVNAERKAGRSGIFGLLRTPRRKSAGRAR